jgi:outer membrane receptor protein involved in Fe transport
MRVRILAIVLAAALVSSPALAATISGLVTDVTGAVLPNARVVLRHVATGQEIVAETGADGRYRLDPAGAGTYLLIVTHPGFSQAARTVVIARADEPVDLPIRLEVGPLHAEVSVTTARAEREIRQIPLHVETIGGDAVAQKNPLSTGDALASVVNITPVGGGPFGVRPRLRGLDSTRLLVLVDGERLNTARQATDRTGAEVGLVSTDAVRRIEIVNGAGTLMYGSDALAGTINIITDELERSSSRQWRYGLNTFYSSNEEGVRGTLTLGLSAPRYAIRVQGGAERFGDYRAGAFDVEDTRPFFVSGALQRADTIDELGFHFNAFPDPFNAPFVRTDAGIPNSSARGHFVNASGLFALSDRRTVRVRYQTRRMRDIGFPDFAQPYFFNATSLPHSDLDRASVTYEAQAVTPWLANLSLSVSYQRTSRLLRNLLPVQFPAPTPQVFFPITVMRLDILSDTEQRVSTPGMHLRAVLTPAANHVLTTGLTVYQDRSRDSRTTTTSTSMVGRVVLGAFGPSAVVFPAPVPLGPASVAHPVRVPNARLRDIAVFAQDEWRLRPNLSIVAGIRRDAYAVTTDATPGYDVSAVVAGATPAIDPATLPDATGATYRRGAFTGDLGLVANPGGRVNPFVRIGRSYRHPNLEEMLFAGPATIGSIAPNVKVRPEVGTNFDAGAKFRAGRVSGGAYAFVNRYRDFIAQDLVVAETPAGPVAQATNYADVRISGVEVSADVPVVVRHGVLTIAGAGAFTRGTITRGADPLSDDALDGSPADNITPVKIDLAVRFIQGRGRWWAEYGVRAQRDVNRVARTLLESPFIIAQDLLSLDGFAIHRIGWGVDLVPRRGRLTLTFAVENLTSVFYREQFQFAPARGRSFTMGLGVGVF